MTLWILVALAVWFTASVPIAVVVGRALAGADASRAASGLGVAPELSELYAFTFATPHEVGPAAR